MTDTLDLWRRKRLDLLGRLALASSTDHFAIEEAIREADERIAELEAGLPVAAPTDVMGDAAHEPAKLIDVARVSQYAAAFVGREGELAVLDEAWAAARAGTTDRARVLSVVALGGEGKTSLVAHWLARCAAEGWVGCEAAFAYSFFSQGAHTTTTSSDQFLAEALTFFGDAATANSPLPAPEKARVLATLVGARRAILVLDGVEPLQYPPGAPHDGRLVDDGLSRLLKNLAALNRGLCIVTTRWSIPDTGSFRSTSAPEIDLPRLPVTDGRRLLRDVFAARGTDAELDAVVAKVGGHALALNLVGSYLRDAHGGDVRRAGEVTLGVADAADGHDKAHRVIAAYAAWLGDVDAPPRGRWWRPRRAPVQDAERPAPPDHAAAMLALLRVAGLFDRPVAAGIFDSLVAGPAVPAVTEPLVAQGARAIALGLARLAGARLVTVDRDSAGRLVGFDAHPLVREYFANRLRATNPDGWRAAHNRIYEHLCASAATGTDPSLEELGPLYQAIVHGCHAGRHQHACDTVYRDRICQGRRFHSMRVLGAVAADLGATACFFTRLWDQLHSNLTPAAKSWLLGQAGSRLQKLGRLADARPPLTAGLAARVDTNDWTNATISAQNLCHLWIADGSLDTALDAADNATTYATRTDDPFYQTTTAASRGAVLFRTGRYDDAHTAFTTANHWHQRAEPDEPWMYSLRGFEECELAVAEVDLAHWRHQLITPTTRESVTALADRATHTRQIAEDNGVLFDAGLDSVTIARTKLYHAHTAGQPAPTDDIDHAVTQLRRANDQTHLPLGLLTRARIHHHNGDHDLARADLDETFEISSREPMRLHLCDTHLFRAHLFHDRHPYPWRHPATDIDTAQALITATGYLHRQPFLDHTRTLIAATTTGDGQGER